MACIGKFRAEKVVSIASVSFNGGGIVGTLGPPKLLGFRLCSAPFNCDVSLALQNLDFSGPTPDWIQLIV
jgi:hypothetical protein